MKRTANRKGPSARRRMRSSVAPARASTRQHPTLRQPRLGLVRSWQPRPRFGSPFLSVSAAECWLMVQAVAYCGGARSWFFWGEEGPTPSKVLVGISRCLSLAPLLVSTLVFSLPPLLFSRSFAVIVARRLLEEFGLHATLSYLIFLQ